MNDSNPKTTEAQRRAMKKYYETHPEKWADYNQRDEAKEARRKYRQSERGKAKAAEYMREYRARLKKKKDG